MDEYIDAPATVPTIVLVIVGEDVFEGSQYAKQYAMIRSTICEA